MTNQEDYWRERFSRSFKVRLNHLDTFLKEISRNEARVSNIFKVEFESETYYEVVVEFRLRYSNNDYNVELLAKKLWETS